MHITRDPKESGNILFLILLAVVLFAALSYAVTNSLRGGGRNAGDENTQVIAASILQTATLWTNIINRLYLVNNYNQISFNTTAPTTSGTCYDGSTAVSPCKVIGLFHSSTGVTPAIETKAIDPNYTGDQFRWVWTSTNVYENGAHIGTAATDELLRFGPITEAVCKEINKKLVGTETVGTVTSATGTYRLSGMMPSFGFASQQASAGTDLTYKNGCNAQSGRHYYYTLIREK